MPIAKGENESLKLFVALQHLPVEFQEERSLPIQKILVANRSEIAIRVFPCRRRAWSQDRRRLAEEDKLALHRFKADESYQIAAARIFRAISGRSKAISRSRKSSASPSCRAPTPFIRAMAFFRKAGIRGCLQGSRHHLHRPDGRHDAPAREQGGSAQSRHRNWRSRGSRHRSPPRRSGGNPPLADEIGYPVMLKASWAAVGAACAPSAIRRTCCAR